MNRTFTIAGMGTYLPPRQVTAAEIEQKCGMKEGWISRAVGVETRHFSDGESASEMGAKALRAALADSELELEDIDAIVNVSATIEQVIPSNASLLARELGLERGVATYDVNATCLSFLVGLDLSISQLVMGRHGVIALVSSELSSLGLNWDEHESCALFGDGAAAVIIKTGEASPSRVLACHMETFPQEADTCTIEGGGSRLPGYLYSEENKHRYLFQMQGKRLFRRIAQSMSVFLEELLPPGLRISDIDLVIPHQASLSAMRLMQKRLGFTDEQFLITIQNKGNLIAASLPMTLYEAREAGKLQKGMKVLLLGTSAGVSIGGLLFEY